MNSILNEALLSTKHIQNAAIIRRKDSEIKAKSLQFHISPLDIDRINKAFEDPKDTRTCEVGLLFSDIYYKPVRVDNRSIYAKNITEKSGVIVARTTNHYIIGTYDHTMYCAVAAEAVEKLAEYFRKKNK